ncbi:MAG: arginine deiminase-related protein, partial [Aureibaculum sp.]
RLAIYHTNVMMCLGEDFSIICLNSIDDKSERKNVIKQLKEDGKEVIDITELQLSSFAGNMLQVAGIKGKKFIIMSSAAHQSLTDKQISSLEKHGEIISSSLDTIEACGGGSARCMMAELFLPKA